MGIWSLIRWSFLFMFHFTETSSVKCKCYINTTNYLSTAALIYHDIDNQSKDKRELVVLLLFTSIFSTCTLHKTQKEVLQGNQCHSRVFIFHFDNILFLCVYSYYLQLKGYYFRNQMNQFKESGICVVIYVISSKTSKFKTYKFKPKIQT